MADPLNEMEKRVFGEDAERCPVTGRIYENGIGALDRKTQTRNFVMERAALADLPKEGERCSQTGREFECGVGAQSKAQQTERFLAEAPAAFKAQRQAAFEALRDVDAAGRA